MEQCHETPAGHLGNVPFVSRKLCRPRTSCLRLLAHFIRLAASRTFCTAGKSRPIRNITPTNGLADLSLMDVLWASAATPALEFILAKERFQGFSLGIHRCRVGGCRFGLAMHNYHGTSQTLPKAEDSKETYR